eukprot:2657999-Amphidinium_carterae.3
MHTIEPASIGIRTMTMPTTSTQSMGHRHARYTDNAKFTSTPTHVRKDAETGHAQLVTNCSQDLRVQSRAQANATTQQLQHSTLHKWPPSFSDG